MKTPRLARFGSPGWDHPDHWPVFCWRCGHRLGSMGAYLVGSPREGFITLLPDLIRLPGDEGGLPRYGLRSGAHLHGHEPLRRPRPGRRGRATMATDGRLLAMQYDSNEWAIVPRFIAYCSGDTSATERRCGAKNLVDADTRRPLT